MMDNMQATTPSPSHHHQHGEDKENEGKTSSIVAVNLPTESSKQQLTSLLPETPRHDENTNRASTSASESTATNPLAHFSKKYIPEDLLWVYNTRSSLKMNLPLQLVQGIDGSVRVQHVDIKFEMATGAEDGFKVLQLQGKDVDTYQGGFQALQKAIQEQLYMDLVLLKQPTSEVEQLAPTSPVRAKQDKWTISRKKRSSIYDPGTGWVKISPVTVTTKPHMSTPDDPFTSLAGRYKHKDILWACSTRESLQQKIPLQIMTGSDGTARVQQVDSNFQKSTGVHVGQQVIQLQRKDIATYQEGGLEEIQNVLQESLDIELIVLRSCSDVVKTRSSLIVTPQKEQSSRIISTITSKASTDESFDDDEKAEASFVTVATSTSTDIAETLEPTLESQSSPAMTSALSAIEPPVNNKSTKKQTPSSSSRRRAWWMGSKFLCPFRKLF